MRKLPLTAIAILGLMGTASMSASAATTKTQERHFTEVLVGARVSTTGSRYENVYRVKESPDAGGAAIQDAALKGSSYPVGAQDTMIAFFRDGAQTTSDTYTLGPPSTSGIGAISGNGTCIHGSGIHVKETCTFTIKGNYNLTTSVTQLTLTGTYTRPTRH
ncbi:MAG: hypothetical protein ACR2NR_03545 [Solirubrobacteraceae bacterium]